MKKTAIIDAIIKEQQKVIIDLEKAKEIYRKSSDIDEEDTIDPEDLSHQAEAKEMQMNLEVKLTRQNQMITALENYKKEQVDEIQEGALVETDKLYIFVGVVAHPLEVDGKKVLTISKNAPIMEKLKGKNVDDTIEIGNDIHYIVSIS